MTVKAKQIEITSPCPITLDRSGISAQDKAMFCAHCTKDVHLLSQMTESEARELMETEAGRDICVSYAVRDDGSIRFRPDPKLVPKLVPISALSRRHAPAPTPVEAPRRRMSLIATIGASLLLAACTAHGDEVVVGEIAAEPIIEQPELVEVIPCEDPEPMPAGGLIAEPLLEPEPEELFDGGLIAEPLPEPEPKPEAKVDKPKERQWKRKRGGIRAHRVDPDDPLANL